MLPLDTHAARNKVGQSAGRDSDHLMTLRLRGSEKSGHRLRALAGWLALALVVAPVTAPLMGCSYFNKDDDLIPDTPADKLYNEGLFLLNNRQEYKEAAKKFGDQSDLYS